jgi:hypothetical protein
VFFGGNRGVPVECSYAPSDFSLETWTWSSDCGTFRQIEAEGPTKRGRFAAAYDPDGHRMLIHGGRTRKTGASGDYRLFDQLWSFDLTTETWSLLTEGDGPEARVSHSAVVADGMLILHGGNASENGAAYTALADTWAYDLVTGEWMELEVTGDPPRRLFHGADLSADGQTMYVYGGGDETAFIGPFFSDLWSLDLADLSWTELHAGGSGSPRGRLSPILVADSARDRLLAFGGHDDGELGNTNQLWQFSLERGRWKELREGDVYNAPPAGFCDFPADFTITDLDSPERRYSSAAAPTDDGRLLIFGGKTDCGVVNDVWALDLASEVWTEERRATSGLTCNRANQECSSMCF